MIASALTVLLMGALMGAIGAVGQDRRMLKHLEGTAGIAGEAAVETIETDFRNARRMWPVEGGGVILTGYCGIERRTFQNDNRLARVVYAVTESGDLVRMQEYLDDLARPQRWIEIVARNVTAFGVQRVPDPVEPVIDPPPPPFPVIPLERALLPTRGVASIAGQRIPERIALTLAFAGQGPGMGTSRELIVR